MSNVKVTVENVTKLHEDSLYLALDKAYENKDLGLQDLIEAELDRRADAHTKMVALRQERERQALQTLHTLENEIQAIFEGFKGKKTLFLIEKLGQQFIDDYTIDEVTLTVFSKVARENQNCSWQCVTLERCRAKVAGLIYDRIYDHYMRDPSAQSVSFLRKTLGE